jgi:acyl carrier protein
MLTGRPTEAEIEATIHRTIIELLERAGKPVPPFDEEDDLMSTGLTSLDLAALVAKLERRWKIDPFLEAKAITEVRTVGDLCRAYQEHVNAR